MTPTGSVVIKASMLDSMSERRIELLVAQLLLELLLLGDVARAGEDSQGPARRVAEHAGVEAHGDAPPCRVMRVSS
jgi:hypothetical protein